MWDTLEEWDREALRQGLILADRLEGTAKLLRDSVAKCLEAQSIEGYGNMVAYSFNSQQYTPQYGGGGGGLPVGKHKVVIVNSHTENSTKGGGYLAFDLTPIEGPLANSGQVQTDRLNLHHTNPKVVEIANGQLAAYCHVLGKFSFNDTVELHNIPFWIEVGYQKGQEPTTENPAGGYTEVKKIFDINGNEPGKAGTGQQPAAAPAQPPAQPPAQVAPTGQPQAWQQPQGGAPAQQPAQGGWAQPQGGAPAGQPAAAPAQAQGGPWAAPAGGAAPPAWGQPQG